MNVPELPLGEMIEKIPILAWSCRPDGTAEFLNQRWLDYTGLSPNEALGWGWQVAIHPEDLGNVMDTWLGLLSSGEPGELEARLRRSMENIAGSYLGLRQCMTNRARSSDGMEPVPILMPRSGWRRSWSRRSGSCASWWRTT